MIKALIVEDDYSGRMLLCDLLKEYGQVEVAEDGHEAVKFVTKALLADAPYDLICMDISMPKMDGITALSLIRELEERHGRSGLDGMKIIMTTCHGDKKHIFSSFRQQCDGYIIKPINRNHFERQLQDLGISKVAGQEPPAS